MDGLRQDLRYAVRALGKDPGANLVAVLTLALGLGATTAVFSVVDAIILRPLPLEDQDRLVIIWEKDGPGGKPLIEVSFSNYLDWRQQATSFENLAAIGSVNWGYDAIGDGDPYHVSVGAVSTSFFETMGVRPALGRTFLPEEDNPDAERVVVVSHSLWQERFDSDPGVIGRPVTFEGETGPQPFTIVGVMPREFDFPRGVDLWTPVGRELADIARANSFDSLAERGLGVLFVVGRLRPGTSIDQATAELDTIVPRLHLTYFRSGESRRVVMTPLVEHIVGATRPALLALSGAVALVLLIACANVAGLLVVRAMARGRDLAVRRALGASRRRVVQHHLVESGLLAITGAVLGLLLAAGMLESLPALAPPDVPRLDEVALDARVLIFALALTVVTVLLVSIGPVFGSRAWRLAESLKAGGPSSTDGSHRTRWRSTFVVSEVAMALALLVGAGLLSRTFVNLLQLDLGFRPDHVVTVGVQLADARYPAYEQRRAFYRALLDRIEGLPEVEAAGAVYQRPFENGPIGFDSVPILDGQPIDQRAVWEGNPQVNMEAVTPDYFRAMGIRLTRGRVFTHQDLENTPPVVIVSEALAARMWRGEDAIGKRLLTVGVTTLDSEDRPMWQTVVGVVDNVRYREIQAPRLDLYVPFYQAPLDVHYLVVRTTADPATVWTAIREIVRDIDPQQSVEAVSTMDAIVARTLQPWRFNALLFGSLATLALVLAAVGLFTTLAATVALRTRELGVRIALGAKPRHVLGLVLGNALRLTLIGALIGFLASFWLSRTFSSLLFEIKPGDPLTLAAATVFLAIVGLVAALVPARRASRVDPLVTLRAE